MLISKILTIRILFLSIRIPKMSIKIPEISINWRVQNEVTNSSSWKGEVKWG